MPETESRRLALYNGLKDLLGAELTDTLMTYLPASTDLATGTDIRELKTDIRELKDEIRGLSTNTDRLSERIDRLGERMDNMQQTMLAGFVAVVAALIGSGFLG